MEMKIKAVLFDLDGTLLDTMPDFSGAVNHALQAAGYPARPPEDFGRIIGGGIRQALRLALPPSAPDTAVEPLVELYRSHYEAHCCDATRPYPGIEAVLRTLADRGLALGVVTNKTEAMAQRVIAHYFPDLPFRLVWGQLETRALKPAPEAGLAAAAELGLRPAEIAFVGDSGDTDMAFARACGMLPVGVTWGYRSRAELTAAGAAKLADSPHQLPTLLASCTGN